MTGPREVVVVAPVTWVAVTEPRDCDCGHQHYGRVPGGNRAWAPQWQFCEDPDCRCTSLRTDLLDMKPKETP